MPVNGQVDHMRMVRMVRKKFRLAKSEELFDDFACTMKQLPAVPADKKEESASVNMLSEIAAHRGRLFLSENYICFAANVFGVE